jgi:hypothetical protein
MLHNHTTLGGTPLDGWWACRKEHSHETDLNVLCGIRTRNSSKLAAADPRLRPRGHWDRHCWQIYERFADLQSNQIELICQVSSRFEWLWLLTPGFNHQNNQTCSLKSLFYLNLFSLCIRQVCTRFPKLWMTPEYSRNQKGHKVNSNCRSANIRRHHNKVSRHGNLKPGICAVLV